MKLPALYIGRFQPFHLGHLDALAQVFAREDSVIIAIGSTEDDYIPGNPFTAGERYQMIEAALEESGVAKGKKFTILAARNIHHFSLWVRHIESLFPPFRKVYTGSPIVKRLFKDAGGHEIIPIRITQKISATNIRSLMLADKKWEHLVPKSVVKLIKEWEGVERIKDIA